MSEKFIFKKSISINASILKVWNALTNSLVKSVKRIGKKVVQYFLKESGEVSLMKIKEKFLILKKGNSFFITIGVRFQEQRIYLKIILQLSMNYQRIISQLFLQ